MKKILKLIVYDLKKRFSLKFSQEMRKETRISNFKLKGDQVCKILIFSGEGDMFRIIYLICSALYTLKFKFGVDI